MEAGKKSAGVTYRVAQQGDAAHVAALINAAFRSEKTGQTWLYDEQAKRIDIVSEQVPTDLINGENTVMLVGTLNDEFLPSMCCFVRRPSGSDGPHQTTGSAWVGLLAVSPDKHKQGLGAAMLFQAEAYARDVWHAELIELDAVSSRKELRSWYNRCGYLETGATRPFPYGDDGRGREILADGLEMIVMLKKLKPDAVGARKCLVET